MKVPSQQTDSKHDDEEGGWSEREKMSPKRDYFWSLALLLNLSFVCCAEKKEK